MATGVKYSYPDEVTIIERDGEGNFKATTFSIQQDGLFSIIGREYAYEETGGWDRFYHFVWGLVPVLFLIFLMVVIVGGLFLLCALGYSFVFK